MEQGAYPLGVSTNPQGGGFVSLGKHSHRKRGKSHLAPQLVLLSLVEEVFPSQQLDMT